MGSRRPKLTVSAEITTIASALYGGYHIVGSVFHFALWGGAVTCLLVVLAISFTGNVLFWISSRRQEKAIKEYVLTLHYVTYADWLVTELQDLWYHWHNAGECLVWPIGAANEIKTDDPDSREKLYEELKKFQVRFFDHLRWIELELPEFRSRILSQGYEAEYQDVLTDLQDHLKALVQKAGKSWKSSGVRKPA